MSKRKPTQQLSALISKSLSKQKCRAHSQPLTQIHMPALQLCCVQCPQSPKIPIEQIIHSPIKAVIGYLSSSTKYNDDKDKQKCDVKKLLECVDEHVVVKSGLEAIVGEIRRVVNQMCEDIVGEFRRRWDEAFQGAKDALRDIRDAEYRYRAVFEELLEAQFQEGTVEELEACLKDFCIQSSEDPTDYLKTRINTLIECQRRMPVVKWQQLKQLYFKISDPFMWTPSNFINPTPTPHFPQSPQPPNLLLPDLSNPLSKKPLSLKLTKSSLILQKLQKNTIIQLDKIPNENDAYYQTDRCQIIGVSYSGLTLYRYGLEKLEKIRSFGILGCGNLLVFGECLVVEAQGRILRVWLRDGKKEVVGLNGTQLKYGNNKYQFEFKNGRDEIVTRSAFHNAI